MTRALRINQRPLGPTSPITDPSQIRLLEELLELLILKECGELTQYTANRLGVVRQMVKVQFHIFSSPNGVKYVRALLGSSIQ